MTPEGLCTKCSATQYCEEHIPGDEVLCDGNGECFRLAEQLTAAEHAQATKDEEIAKLKAEAERWRAEVEAIANIAWRNFAAGGQRDIYLICRDRLKVCALRKERSSTI